MSPILRAVCWCFGWFVAGVLLVLLLYQVPARHTVLVGYNDEPYTQGFGEAANRWGVVTDQTGATEPLRWSGPDSALIFPQIGLPARATLRLRAWRPSGTQLPRVRVLLNGREELGAFAATGDWEEHSFTISSGLTKPRDLFLQLEVEPPLEFDGEWRGVQVDRTALATAGWPILPYPAQLLGGGVATLLAALALRRPLRIVLAAGVMGLLFLGVYRLQISPYPLRAFWLWLIVLWLGVLAVQMVEWYPQRPPVRVFPTWSITWARVPDLLAGAMLLVWTLLLWRAGQAHVVLSLPGVEKDFRVFATRSEALWCPSGVEFADAACVLRADGFYQLGYPFVLWLLRSVTSDNAFLAARVAALASGVLLLLATYGLGRALLGGFAGLLALLLLVLNRWTSEYSLLLGTDMPFAAAWILALLGLVTARRSLWHAFGTGLLCGAAFMIRHPGILLLPLGAGFLLWPGDRPRPGARPAWHGWRWDLAGMLLAGWLAISSPQLSANLLQQGRPLYSQQAKNIWLAVYGNTDWGRWGEASDDVSLRDVVAQAPLRFFGNWWANVRGFWGAGSEDTSEWGRAVAIRLLTFPANMLAFAGLGFWLLRGNRHERFLLLAAVVYITSVAVGFLLPRFALPLVPIWALAAVAAVCRLWWLVQPGVKNGARARSRLLLGGGLIALLLMVGAPGA
ncbi:MAG TPA: glycosyltransferase family 39 protein, partial [Herpetosiphonaceae bacterium]|nr:glycosyltransferase family 39 protein [Herpetosiphonaceae bacterium]